MLANMANTAEGSRFINKLHQAERHTWPDTHCINLLTCLQFFALSNRLFQPHTAESRNLVDSDIFQDEYAKKPVLTAADEERGESHILCTQDLNAAGAWTPH